MEIYRHTQNGYVLPAFIGVVFLILIAVQVIAGRFQAFPLVVLGIVLAAVLLLFASLTVTVTPQAITLRYGIGLIRRQFPLSEIKEWKEVRNKWTYGWGVRFTPHGWLYNVSGLKAVEFATTRNENFRIGTDDVEGLIKAVESAKG